MNIFDKYLYNACILLLHASLCFPADMNKAGTWSNVSFTAQCQPNCIWSALMYWINKATRIIFGIIFVRTNSLCHYGKILVRCPLAGPLHVSSKSQVPSTIHLSALPYRCQASLRTRMLLVILIIFANDKNFWLVDIVHRSWTGRQCAKGEIFRAMIPTIRGTSCRGLSFNNITTRITKCKWIHLETN